MDGSAGVLLQNVNLEDIVTERKTERVRMAEQKRKIDLQRIRDMYSRFGIEPLQRFPKEIWCMIFKELDTTDLGNVYKVHPTFRGLLEPTAPQFFQIMPQLEKFANGLPELGVYGCVHLRGVSKLMKNTYDRNIEKNLDRMIRESEAFKYRNSSVMTLHLWDRDEREKLSRLLPLFKNEAAKHFFPKALGVSFYLELSDEEEDEDIDVDFVYKEFKRNLFGILELIGDQLWIFRFHLSYVDMVKCSTGQAYILLQRLVKLMPNLKWLEVDIQLDYQEVDADEQARSILEEYPFPRLSSLERMSFHSPWATGGVFNIYETILAANGHVNLFDFHERRSRVLDNLPVQRIQSLSLTSCQFSNAYIPGPKTIQDVQGIVNFNWPLQQIHLTLLDYTETNFASPMNSVLEFLERFPTLETVKLKKVKGIRFGKNDAFHFLRLPNLSELEVKLVKPEIECEGNVDFFFSLQFLLRSERLKTLKWDMRCVEDDELRTFLKEKEQESDGNGINFRSGLRCLYASNIWNVFPSLDTVNVSITKLKVCRCCPTRQDCEEKSFICEQMYRRSALVNGVMPVDRFLDSHKCSRENALQNCAMLQS